MEREIHYIESTKTPLGKDPFTKMRVAAYCRVSSQSDEQHGSLETQTIITPILSTKILIGKIQEFTLKQAAVNLCNIVRNLKSYLRNAGIKK